MKKMDYLPIFPYLRLKQFSGKSNLEKIRPIPNVTSWVPTYSGATALGLAARSLKKAGKTHLLVPSYNCGHEFEPFLRENFKIGMYRVNRNGNTDIDHLASQLKCINQVVMVTHFFGFPQPIREIVELCRSKGIYVIEDCAHAYLSCLAGRPLGSWGDMSVFSCRKSLPSPDGGALVINNPDIPLIRPAIPPNSMSVVKKTLQLIISGLLTSAKDSSPPVYKMLCDLKHLLFVFQSLVQKVIRKDSLYLHSPDDESYNYNIEILDWQMSFLSLKVIGNCDHRQIRKARIKNYQYVADALKNSENLQPLYRVLPGETCPLGFPLVIMKKGIGIQNVMEDFPYLFKWWDCFHPALNWVDFPESAWLKRNCYFLSIHQDLRKSHLDYLIDCAVKADKRLGSRMS